MRVLKTFSFLPARLKPCRSLIKGLRPFIQAGFDIIGSTGLANIRDFQIPKAYFEGQLHNDIAYANDEGEWTIMAQSAGRWWACTLHHTPFEVAAWLGANYPYKYDLGHICVLWNAAFDEHDPSLYVVLTAPTYGEPGRSTLPSYRRDGRALRTRSGFHTTIETR